MKKKMKVKGNHVIFSLVFLVLGYMMAFSYHLTQGEEEKPALSGKQWERDLELRNQLVELEEKTGLFKKN